MVYGHAKVARSITVSHCTGQRLNPNTKGPPDFIDFSYDVYGCYTPERATRYARRTFSDNTIVINNVEMETRNYATDVETFISVAERTDNNDN